MASSRSTALVSVLIACLFVVGVSAKPYVSGKDLAKEYFLPWNETKQNLEAELTRSQRNIEGSGDSDDIPISPLHQRQMERLEEPPSSEERSREQQEDESKEVHKDIETLDEGPVGGSIVEGIEGSGAGSAEDTPKLAALETDTVDPFAKEEGLEDLYKNYKEDTEKQTTDFTSPEVGDDNNQSNSLTEADKVEEEESAQKTSKAIEEGSGNVSTEEGVAVSEEVKASEVEPIKETENEEAEKSSEEETPSKVEVEEAEEAHKVEVEEAKETHKVEVQEAEETHEVEVEEAEKVSVEPLNVNIENTVHEDTNITNTEDITDSGDADITAIDDITGSENATNITPGEKHVPEATEIVTQEHQEEIQEEATSHPTNQTESEPIEPTLITEEEEEEEETTPSPEPVEEQPEETSVPIEVPDDAEESTTITEVLIPEEQTTSAEPVSDSVELTTAMESSSETLTDTSPEDSDLETTTDMSSSSEPAVIEGLPETTSEQTSEEISSEHPESSSHPETSDSSSSLPETTSEPGIIVPKLPDEVTELPESTSLPDTTSEVPVGVPEEERKEEVTEEAEGTTAVDEEVIPSNQPGLVLTPKNTNSLESALSKDSEEVLLGSTEPKRIGAYIVVGMILLSFLSLIGYIVMKKRIQRRRKAQEVNKDIKDTEKALLSLSEYKDHPENDENNIKNNELTPTAIKQNSHINKFEKNTNFSSPKNLNTTANEKNIEKDNVLKSTSDTLTQVIIEDNKEEELKPEEDRAEKLIVRTHVDQDSIPKKAVLVNRSSGGYTTVQQDSAT